MALYRQPCGDCEGVGRLKPDGTPLGVSELVHAPVHEASTIPCRTCGTRGFTATYGTYPVFARVVATTCLVLFITGVCLAIWS